MITGLPPVQFTGVVTFWASADCRLSMTRRIASKMNADRSVVHRARATRFTSTRRLPKWIDMRGCSPLAFSANQQPPTRLDHSDRSRVGESLWRPHCPACLPFRRRRRRGALHRVIDTFSEYSTFHREMRPCAWLKPLIPDTPYSVDQISPGSSKRFK